MRSVGGHGLEVFFRSEEFDHAFQPFSGGVVPEDEETPVQEPGALVEGFKGGEFVGGCERFDGGFDGDESHGCFFPILDEDFARQLSPEYLKEGGVNGCEVVHAGISGFFLFHRCGSISTKLVVFVFSLSFLTLLRRRSEEGDVAL